MFDCHIRGKRDRKQQAPNDHSIQHWLNENFKRWSVINRAVRRSLEQFFLQFNLYTIFPIVQIWSAFFSVARSGDSRSDSNQAGAQPNDYSILHYKKKQGQYEFGNQQIWNKDPAQKKKAHKTNDASWLGFLALILWKTSNFIDFLERVKAEKNMDEQTYRRMDTLALLRLKTRPIRPMMCPWAY